jgi:hypothetical protein
LEKIERISSLRKFRADEHQLVQPIDRLVRRPADSAQQQNAEQGIERPREMTGDIFKSLPNLQMDD